MKTIYSLGLFLLLSQLVFSNTMVCPDPPTNDDPCINSTNPPIDLSSNNIHSGTTCCATVDFDNLSCSNASNASVWYMFTPDSSDEGYTINVTSSGDSLEGPMTVEVYSGLSDQGCNGGFMETIAASCMDTEVEIHFGNCFESNEVVFIKISTSVEDENCGEFTISVSSPIDNNSADKCIDLADFTPIVTITNDFFSFNYQCTLGSLDFACPEILDMGGCEEFTTMPTVWFQIVVDTLADQLFTTVEPNGNWNAVWAVYAGSDCDNLTLINLPSMGPCSNDDNTPFLHQTPIDPNVNTYWVMVTADPNSLTSEGIGDGSFEFCASTTINATICLGDLEGACDDESLIMLITERENAQLPLDGPFCQGEEVTINISFIYDASETGADWFIGFVPKFGNGWDMSQFDYDGNAPNGNGQDGLWYAEGSGLGPIIQEPVVTLCTYRDEEGILQICNQLCEPCSECEVQGMVEGDPLPSGYFWVNSGGNAGCDNDGSPGEGWGIGSIIAQIDWTFTLTVKTFGSAEECMDNNDLSISFQTFSDGVAGCWEDPVSECLLDRAMVSPPWRIGCSEMPPAVLVDSTAICSNEMINVTVSTEDGSPSTIVVVAIDNPYITGANDHEFENGVGVINDVLVNTNTVDEILLYEVFAGDPTVACNGPKSIIEVVVYSQYIADFEEAVCACVSGCTIIGTDEEGATYLWSTGDTTAMINVCPLVATTYSLTTTDSNGCEQVGTVIVDCDGLIEECIEPEYYKLVYDFFVDLDENGINDSLDIPFGEGSFFIEPDHILIYNTNIEEDTIQLPEGEYSLVFSPANLECWALTTDSIVPVMLDSANNCVKVEFGLYQTESKRDIDLAHYLVTRCNSDRFFHIIAENEGTQIESGILWAVLDENVIPNGFPTNATIDTFIAPNKVGWYFDGLLPGDKTSRTVKVYIPGPPDFPVGGILKHTIYAELNNNDSMNEIWGEREVQGFVQCGYDPNDKIVEPNHEEGYTNIDQEKLIYKIRFQNTGNAPAEDIEVRDTLSEFLDASTVEYIIGSHDEFLTLSRIGERVLMFRLANVNLPDSTSDLEASQGYFIFKVGIKENVSEGTVIENTANIYFDNNPAVVTNTTKNILYPDLDNDGYFSIEDCDEEDMAINPGAEEIPNNDVDEDCDGVALIIDNDMDGFNSDEDCDDEDAAINPDAEEIINNDIDENCDNLVVIVDVDMDGFNSDEDCDDADALINPDAVEIVNNEIDEDCDGEALIIDVDMDGFNSDEDCDDEDALINPDAIEIPNNEIDEDCDGEALIIDVDMDGFNSDEDCNDNNPDINPDAVDIPDNGIDEDCDGVDAMILNVNDANDLGVSIWPNPSNDAFNIMINTTEKVDYTIRDVMGREVKRGIFSSSQETIHLGLEPDGVYIIFITNPKNKKSKFYKLLKI